MWPDPAVLRADTCALPWFLDVARIIQELGYEPFSWRLGCIVIPTESRRPAVKADFPGRSHRSPDQEPGRERGREATDSAPVDIPIQPAPCPLATGPTDSDFSPPEAPLWFPSFPVTNHIDFSPDSKACCTTAPLQPDIVLFVYRNNTTVDPNLRSNSSLTTVPPS